MLAGFLLGVIVHVAGATGAGSALEVKLLGARSCLHNGSGEKGGCEKIDKQHDVFCVGNLESF